MSKYIINLQLKEYIINLDLPEDKRWIHLLEIYSESLLKIKPILKKIIDMQLSNYKYFLYPLIKLYKVSGFIKYKKELESIANFLQIDFEYVLLLQLYYEMNAACTSIVTKINDSYSMFRTMDWPMEFLKELTVNLIFMKNNEIVCYGTSWVGYIGLLTVTIPNKCCIAINYRRTSLNKYSIFKNMFNCITLSWPIGYLIRDICENSYNLDMIRLLLKKSNLISPCYITISYDIRKPEIIKRDPDSYSIESGDFVIQTNCDNDKLEPNILYSIERRNICKNIIMKKNNLFGSIDELLNLLHIEPVLNSETIYINILNPNQKPITYI